MLATANITHSALDITQVLVVRKNGLGTLIGLVQYVHQALVICPRSHAGFQTVADRIGKVQ